MMTTSASVFLLVVAPFLQCLCFQLSPSHKPRWVWLLWSQSFVHTCFWFRLVWSAHDCHAQVVWQDGIWAQECMPAFLKTSLIIGQVHSHRRSLGLSDPECPEMNPVSLGPKRTRLLRAEVTASSNLLLGHGLGTGHHCAVQVLLPTCPCYTQGCRWILHTVLFSLYILSGMCELKIPCLCCHGCVSAETPIYDFRSVWEFPEGIKLDYLDIKFYWFINQ